MIKRGLDFFKKNKKGIVNEIVAIVIAVIIFAVAVGFIVIFIKGKGFGEGGILDSIRNMLKFGR